MALLTSLVKLSAYCFIASAIYAIGLGIYNIFFHPFRKIPGPRLNAVSRIPWIRDWLSGRLHRTVQKMHDQYGPIVRVAPDEISFIEAEAWGDIYGNKGAKAFVRDPKWYANLTEGQDDIIVATEPNHTRFRRMFSPGFSDKALKDNEHLIMSNISLLISKLSAISETSTPVADMVKWYNFLTFDVIGTLVYSSDFSCLSTGEYHPWLGVVLQNIRLSSYVALMERYNIFKRVIMAMLPKHLLEKRNMHLSIIRDKCSRRDAATGAKKDVISTLPLGEKGGITTEEAEANLALMTMAGSETSATSLSAASYFLTRNVEAMNKLKQEILGSFQNEDQITWEKVKQLPYLTAVMKEALRLYPPTPVGLPRRVVSNGEVVCGHFIPNDTVVYITQYSAYRSSLNFRRPNQFIPERWLDDPRFHGDKREVFQPFITGPYSCIGKSLAYMEIGLTLAHMVWNFDWSVEGKCDFDEQQVYALWQKSPLNFRLSKRTHS